MPQAALAVTAGHPTAGLCLAAERAREAAGDLAVSRADIAAAGRIERARSLAIRAHGRKDRHGELHHFHIAANELEKLQNNRTERGDTRWLRDTSEETAALERGRGETVERRRGGGLRIKTRDGLEALRDAKGTADAPCLTLVQYRAGLLYRDIFEGAREDLPSQLGKIQGGCARASTPADSNRKGWADRKRELSAKLVEIEGKVMKATLDARAVTMLREIAGAGSCVSHLATSGSARVAASTRLKAALDVVAMHFGVSDARVQMRVDRAAR